MPPPELLLEGDLTPREQKFDAANRRLPEHHPHELRSHPAYGRALKFYLLLTEAPELFDDLGVDPERLFWSRYYWFLVFERRYRAAEGPDAGIEQQAFQLLEEGAASGFDIRWAEDVAAKVALDAPTPAR